MNYLQKKILLKKNKGVALIIVLWMLSLLTILAAGYSNTMRTETSLTANLVNSAKAKALAEAGISQGIAELLRPMSEQKWVPNGSTYTYEFNGNNIKVRIFDESGKIDLNAANPELIQRLLESTQDIDYDEASFVADAILDWRDKDSLTRLNGAEDEDYERMGYSYGAKDNNFNTLNELQQIVGITPKIFKKILPAITIYSRKATVNKIMAPREVLNALPGMDDETIEEIMAQRLSANEADGLIGADIKRKYSTAGKTFTIVSHGYVNNTKASINTVVLLKRYKNRPYSILSWQEDNVFEDIDNITEALEKDI